MLEQMAAMAKRQDDHLAHLERIERETQRASRRGRWRR